MMSLRYCRSSCAPLRPAGWRLLSNRATLTALIERIPVLVPEAPQWKVEVREVQAARRLLQSKMWPEELTFAEEGPDRTRARLKLDEIIQTEAVNADAASTIDNERSTQRAMRQRLFLLLKVDGRWQLPQVGERVVREVHAAVVARKCNTARCRCNPYAHLHLHEQQTCTYTCSCR